MADNTTEDARSAFEERLNELVAELETVTRQREITESAVAESERTTRQLKDRVAELCEREGALRGKIGDTKRALRAAERL